MIMSYEQIKELAFMVFKYIMIIKITAFFILFATKLPDIVKEAKARKKDKTEEPVIKEIITKIESTDPKKDVPKMKKKIGFVSAISDDN